MTIAGMTTIYDDGVAKAYAAPPRYRVDVWPSPRGTYVVPYNGDISAVLGWLPNATACLKSYVGPNGPHANIDAAVAALADHLRD